MMGYQPRYCDGNEKSKRYPTYRYNRTDDRRVRWHRQRHLGHRDAEPRGLTRERVERGGEPAPRSVRPEPIGTQRVDGDQYNRRPRARLTRRWPPIAVARGAAE